LTEREEEVLLAISYDGLSQDATAKRLGVSDSAISNFKKSAVRKARAAVGYERAAELVGLH
jgi:DNA-directed RNA polymerase specialized sigma subunit